MAKGRPPQYTVQLSRKVGDDYKRVRLCGLWPAGKKAPRGVAFNGSVSGEYEGKSNIGNLQKFFKKADADEDTIYVSVWKAKKRRDDDDDDDDDDEDDDEERDDKDDEDDEPRPKEKDKKSKKSKKGKGRKEKVDW